VYSASTVDTIGRYRLNVDGTLLSAVMDQIFIKNGDFYTPPALDAAVNFNSLH